MHINNNFYKAVGKGVSELVENVVNHSDDVAKAVVKKRRPRIHEVRYEKATPKPKQLPVSIEPTQEEIDRAYQLAKEYEFDPNISSLEIIPRTRPKDWELIDIYDKFIKGRLGLVIADIEDPEIHNILKFNSDLIGRRRPNPPTRIVGIRGEYPKGLIGANDDIILLNFKDMTKTDLASLIYHTLAHMYLNLKRPFMHPANFKDAVVLTKNNNVDTWGAEGLAMVWLIRQNLLHYLHNSLGRMPTIPEYQTFVKGLSPKKINDLFGNLHGGQYAPNDLGIFLNALTRFAKKGLKLVKKTNA